MNFRFGRVLKEIASRIAYVFFELTQKICTASDLEFQKIKTEKSKKLPRH